MTLVRPLVEDEIASLRLAAARGLPAYWISPRSRK